MDENTATPGSIDWKGTAFLWRKRAWDEGYQSAQNDANRWAEATAGENPGITLNPYRSAPDNNDLQGS